MRSQSTLVHALALSVAASLAASSHAVEPAVREGDHVVRDFVFASGERLPEVRLHYRTLGAPVRDAQGVVRNAVLLLHGTGGTGAQFLQPQFAAEMFGPGQPLDAATHFVVMPDAVATPPVGRITDTAEEVARRERELVAAIGSRDLAAYDRLVDDGYVALRGNGDQTKAQVMETYRAGRVAYRGLDIADVEVRVLGETAVLSARTFGTRIEEGRETPNRVRYLRVWAKRDGAWRAMLQMAVPLGTSP